MVWFKKHKEGSLRLRFTGSYSTTDGWENTRSGVILATDSYINSQVRGTKIEEVRIVGLSLTVCLLWLVLRVSAGVEVR